MLCFHSSNSYIFSKSKHYLIHKELHCLTKSIALLIKVMRENKFLHLKFEEIKLLVYKHGYSCDETEKRAEEV